MRFRVIALVLLSASYACAQSRAPQSTATSWVGTWATSAFNGDRWHTVPTLVDSTLREVVHTSIAGKQLRVRLTNEFGIEPLRIGAASVAMSAGGSSIDAATGGSPERGEQVILHYECGQCHTIPGIPHADGVFGPPLTAMGARTMVGGNFPNEPDTLVHWIQAPTSMKPKTAMPDLGLSEQQARDAAAYLETLR